MNPGSRLEHYEVVAQTSAGGMGAVYRAEDTRLRRPARGRAVAALWVALLLTGCVSVRSESVTPAPADSPAVESEVVAASPAPASVTAAPEPDCPAPLAPYVKVTLYMGRGTRDVAAWQAFVDEVLLRHFPDGGSMVQVSGWWEGRVGDAAELNSRMLVMLHPAAGREAFAEAVQAVIADIKQRFGHRAVLWEEARICATI